MSLHLGAIFSSFEELQQKVKEYEKANFVTLYMRDSITLEAARNMLNKKAGLVKPENKYYYIHYTCIRGGRKFVSRSSGIRNSSSRTKRQDCHMYIRITMSPDDHLRVVAMNELHNHELNEEEYLQCSKQRKLTEDEQGEVKQLVEAGVKTNFIVEHLRKKGKATNAKDIHNFVVKDRKKTASGSVENVPVVEVSEESEETVEYVLKEGDEDAGIIGGLVGRLTKNSAFCHYLAKEMEVLPVAKCEELIEHTTLKLFELKKRSA